MRASCEGAPSQTWSVTRCDCLKELGDVEVARTAELEVKRRAATQRRARLPSPLCAQSLCLRATPACFVKSVTSESAKRLAVAVAHGEPPARALEPARVSYGEGLRSCGLACTAARASALAQPPPPHPRSRTLPCCHVRFLFKRARVWSTTQAQHAR